MDRQDEVTDRRPGSSGTDGGRGSREGDQAHDRGGVAVVGGRVQAGDVMWPPRVEKAVPSRDGEERR